MFAWPSLFSIYSIALLSLTSLIYAGHLFIAALEQQQQKTSNSVLHRVISLTTANHNNDNNNFTKSTKPTSTAAFIPEKLQFSAYEKFEGEFEKQGESIN